MAVVVRRHCFCQHLRYGLSLILGQHANRQRRSTGHDKPVVKKQAGSKNQPRLGRTAKSHVNDDNGLVRQEVSNSRTESTHYRFHNKQRISRLLHRSQANHLIGFRGGGRIDKVLLDGIASVAIHVVDAVIHQDCCFILGVEDQSVPLQDSQFFAPFVKNIFAQSFNQLMIESSSYCSQMLVARNDPIRSGGVPGSSRRNKSLRPIKVPPCYRIIPAKAVATVIATTPTMTTTRHPPGLGKPFRISRPVSDS